MPRRVVTLHRWQIAAAFLAVTAAFVVATAIATHATNQAHALAVKNRTLLRQQEDLLARQNATDRSVCAKVDRLERALEAIVIAGAANPRPGDYGYTYWARIASPAERRQHAAQPRAILGVLRQASCDPGNLPGR